MRIIIIKKEASYWILLDEVGEGGRDRLMARDPRRVADVTEEERIGALSRIVTNVSPFNSAAIAGRR